MGMGYSLACGSGDDGGKPPSLPGIGVAMAQAGGCEQWELQGQKVEDEYALLPAGWTPLGTQGGNAYWVWLTRCAK